MPTNPEVQNIQNLLTSLNHQFEVVSRIKSGKEADVFKVLFDNKVVAMKLYKKPEERSFQNSDQYLLGKNYKKQSHKKAIAKGNKFAKSLKHTNWVKREFVMLEKLYELGAKIPQPIFYLEDAVFMEFLGDENKIAPRLIDATLTIPEMEHALKSIIETMLIFWNFGIIHADLSEYNILWWKNKPYIIDFPQAVDKRNNPNAEFFLNRDLQNIINFFSKFISVDAEEIQKSFLS